MPLFHFKSFLGYTSPYCAASTNTICCLLLLFPNYRLVRKKYDSIIFKKIIREKFRNQLKFLSVFYHIMCLMKAFRSFGKIAILKIWELVSLVGILSLFGVMHFHFSGMKKNILTNVELLLLIQLRFRHTMHLKMTVWISVLWKIFM